MLNVQFTLRKPTSKRLTTINALMYFDGKRCTFSVRRKIRPNDWDFNKQRAKPSYTYAEQLNTYLDKIALTVNSRYLELPVIGKYPSCEEFKLAVANMTGAAQKQQPTIIEIIERQAGRASSPINYNNLKAQVKKFTRAKQRSIRLEAITADWYNDFQVFMIANLAPSYAAVMASHFKTVVRHSGYDWPGKNEMLAVKRKGGKRKKDVGEKAALTFEEIRRLNAAEVDDEKRSAVRYMLFLACVTGLRVSDWHQYSLSGNIIEADGFKFIRIVMQKTNLIAYPPLWPVAEGILNALGGSMVPEFWRHIETDNIALGDNFRYNAPAMGEALEFNRKVVLIRPAGPKKVQQEFSLYEKFTSKMGRDTFVTRFEGLGLAEKYIKLMTGHSPGNDPVKAYNTNDFKNYVPLMAPFLQKFKKEVSPWAGEVRYL